MINFPDTPTANQQFAVGNTIWTWDTAKWVAASAPLATPLAINQGGTNNATLPLSNVTGVGLTSTLLWTTGTQVQPAAYANGTIGSWSDGQMMLIQTGATNNYGTGGYIGLAAMGGTLAAPTATVSGANIGGLFMSGWGTAFAWEKAAFYAAATETWSATGNGTRFIWNTTPIGSTATATVMTLASNGQLSVYSSAGVTPIFSSAASGNAGMILQVTGGRQWNVLCNTSNYLIWDGTAGANRMQCDTSGQWYNTNGTWASLSSRTLKRNIKPLSRGLDAVLALDPISYQFTDDAPMRVDGTQYGLIAEDVQLYAPELCGKTFLATAYGNERDQVPQEYDTLNLGLLPLLLVNALKEINARLEKLEAR